MIYFVQRESDRCIKIGTTIRLSRRLGGLVSQHGKIVLLGVTDGSYADESALHARFNHLAQGGEWFMEADDLVDFIRREARPWNNVDEVPLQRPVKLSQEAIKWARIASGYTGESMAEYVSRITMERGREDAERLHAEATKAKPPAKKKGGKET